jgi:hypothetical protein
MGWIKDMFGEGSSDPNHWDKKFKERMAKEQKEKEEIFDMSKNVDQINERRADNAIEYRIAQKKGREQEVEEERKKEEKASDDLKLVIDTAKLQCDLCTNPIGDLKVNFRTPTIQGKKTATVKEKDMKSLIFKGNCKKSPNSSSPCASVMQLGDWKDVGNVKVQEQFPLLLKSTIKCNYGGIDIKITDCGQRNEPSGIDAVPKEAKKKQILSAVWMCAEMKEEIENASFGQTVSILAKTKNYSEGETLSLVVTEVNDNDVAEGIKKITVTGKVKADGSVELREEVKIGFATARPTETSPQEATPQEATKLEYKKDEIHLTHEGKSYTKAEWKEYQDNWHDEMEKRNTGKKKGFWG